MVQEPDQTQVKLITLIDIGKNSKELHDPTPLETD